MGGSVLSNGSESLRCVAPASMYSMPGTLVVGFALCSEKSRFHCIATLPSHIGGAPTPLGFPGMHVKSLVPGRRIFIFPWASISATVAFLVTLEGPAERARAILLCLDSWGSDDTRSGVFICAGEGLPIIVSNRERIQATSSERRLRNINTSYQSSDIVFVNYVANCDP